MANKFSLELSCSGDDSDELELFFSSHRVNKTKPKYRVSDGSLKDFIIDEDDDEEDEDDEDKENDSSIKVFPPQQTDEPFLDIKKTLIFSDSSDSEDSFDSPQSSKVLKPLENKSESLKIVDKTSKDFQIESDLDPQISDTEEVYESLLSRISRNRFSGGFQSTEKTLNEKKAKILSSSDDECESLLDKVKKKTSLITDNTPRKVLKNIPKTPIVFSSSDEDSFPSPKTTSKRSDNNHRGGSFGKSSFKTPNNKNIPKKFSSRHLEPQQVGCVVKGCFLRQLKDKPDKNFKNKRQQMSLDMFQLFNSSVFDNKLPKNMPIKWSNRLTKTAGTTTCKRQIKTITTLKSQIKTEEFICEISLSEKILTNPVRLRDTLIHELCHAAVWCLNKSREAHGPKWKAWGKKAQRVHPELPFVERCHSYSIEYKYIYECTGCKQTHGRHSKSLDTNKFVCSICHNRMKLRSESQKPLTPFAKYVKENYGNVQKRIKNDKNSVDHSEVMRSLGEQFRNASIS